VGASILLPRMTNGTIARDSMDTVWLAMYAASSVCGERLEGGKWSGAEIEEEQRWLRETKPNRPPCSLSYPSLLYSLLSSGRILAGAI